MGSLGRLIRRIKRGAPVVIVSGLPRSGTSMMMQMLHAGGVEAATDGERSRDEDNPKGYYELERVKDLDKTADKSWMGDYRGKAVKVISFLLRDLPLDLNYRVIFIQRNLDEILMSQRRMLERRGEAAPEGDEAGLKENFTTHLKHVRYFLEKTPQFDTLYLTYRGVQARPRDESERIAAFLGGRLDVDAMAAVVDRALYRNRRAAD